MNANPNPMTSGPILEMDHASVLRADRLIVENISFAVHAGQHTAILGANGAGKSTVVQLIARQIYPLARADTANAVRVFGRERWNVSELRGLLGIVSPLMQRDYTRTENLEVFDAVVSSFFSARGLSLDQRATDAMRDRAAAALEQIGATHLIGRTMATLSTGEARRVLIARALVHEPRALLLDEPCAGLDLVSRRHFLQHLRGLAQAGTTLVLVTHHVEEIIPEISQVLLLRAGHVLDQGAKTSMLTDTKLSAAYGLPIEVSRHGDWYHAAIAANA